MRQLKDLGLIIAYELQYLRTEFNGYSKITGQLKVLKV